MKPWEQEYAADPYNEDAGPWATIPFEEYSEGTQEGSKAQGDQPVGKWISIDEAGVSMEEVVGPEGTLGVVEADGKMEAWTPLPAPEPTLAEPFPQLPFQTETGAPQKEVSSFDYSQDEIRLKQIVKDAFAEVTQVPTPSAGTIMPEPQRLVPEPIMQSFSTVEGYRTKAYKDSQGLTTVGVGFNMEQTGAQKIWEQAGVDQDFEAVKSGKEELSDQNIEKLLSVTLSDSESKAQARAEELGLKWEELPDWHQAILTDIAFNTGSVKGWRKVFLNTDPIEVLREARRREGGKHTKGMDNRVARIGLSLGLITSVEEARAAGLTLADLSKEEEVRLAKGPQPDTIPPTLAEKEPLKPWEQNFGAVS